MPFGRLWQRLFGGRERRLHPRTQEPYLLLTIDGHEYATLDWSLGGFRLAEFHVELKLKDRIAGKIDPRDGSCPGEFEAEVVRLLENGDIGCRLLEISTATFAAMSELQGR